MKDVSSFQAPIAISYLKRRLKYIIFYIMTCVFFDFYFVFLMDDSGVIYLHYLNFLIIISFLVFLGIDYLRFRKRETEKRQALQQEDIIFDLFPDYENKDIAAHDAEILKNRLQEKFDENCDLQDYVARWCHELKIPLSIVLLLDKKIEDAQLRSQMQEQHEKIKGQVNSMLLGCRLQSPLFDIQIKRTSLLESVKASILNNQFFLIQKGFSLDIRVEELSVYSDSAWLVYILDQLLGNTLKYAGEEPRLRIWTERLDKSVKLFVEDNGEGIKESDIRRIFEKGFTGSNYHNGRYKSTGMGLYMVSKIITRLGHEIITESEYGIYTRFCIVFPNLQSM